MLAVCFLIMIAVILARYRFFKQMESVIHYEKCSHAFPLAAAGSFPPDLMRQGPHFGPYLCYKSTVLMHLFSHHVGKGSTTGSLGGIEQVLRCLHDIMQSKPLLPPNSSSSAMLPPPSLKKNSSYSLSMPPPTPGYQYPHLTPHSTGGLTPFLGPPTTPHHTPGLSVGMSSMPTTPQLTPHVSPWAGHGTDATGNGKRERGGSVDLGVQPVDKEIYATWKYNPSEKEDFAKPSSTAANTTSTVSDGTSPKPDESTRVEGTADGVPQLVPPQQIPTIDRQSSVASSVSSLDGESMAGVGGEGVESAAKRKRIQRKSALEELLWGSPTSSSGKNVSGIEEEKSPHSLLMGVTGVQFLQHLRKSCVGTAGSTLDETFLEKWVGRTGCLLLRAVVSVDARNKKIDVTLDQPGFSRGQISSRFAYKDKVIINVVEEKEYQYSRRIDDNRNHRQSYNLHHKTRRGGGRKKLIDNETKGLLPGSEAGSSGGSNPLTQIHFQDVLSQRRIGKDGMQDVEGGQLRAMALPIIKAADRMAAAVAGTVAAAGSASTNVKVLGQLVQFVAIDPDILWTREVSVCELYG